MSESDEGGSNADRSNGDRSNGDRSRADPAGGHPAGGDRPGGDAGRRLHRRAAELFDRARTLRPEEQDPFLEATSAGDAALLEEVRSLLRHHREAGGFLAGPALPSDLPDLHAPGEAAADPARPERVGPYRILQVLGEGGMGTVFLAEQAKPFRRRVALKVIKLGMDTREVVARFEAERQALAMMSHPNIARIHDAGATADGRPYFVMEFVPGEPITGYCDRRRLSTRRRLELLIPVCEAVQHAHQKAIIHRDLKPSNILVMEEDGKPIPKIIDFGVAKATDHRLTERTLFTEIGQIIGTPEYMSPEQAERSALDIDTRTDVYSLGVLLYELVAGALPFDPQELRRAGYHEIQRIIREVDPPRPSTRLSSLGPGTAQVASNRSTDAASLGRQIRGDLDWIAMKAMEKERARRYGTAAELAQDIVRHLTHEPVAAGPPGPGYRLKKLAKKHRGPVAAVAAVFLVLTLGLVAVALLYGRAERARSDADAAASEALRYAGELEGASATIEAERNTAIAAREEAVEQRDIASRNLYIAQMRLAFDDWDKGQVSRLRRTLRDHLPGPGRPDLRGWEWYYLLHLCRQDSATLHGHRAQVGEVRWSPDGRRLASVAGDGTVRIWDPEAGAELRRIHGLLYGRLRVAWSPDGRRLASTVGCGGVTIWEADSGVRLGVLGGDPPAAIAIDWAPEGEMVATLSPEGEIGIWDAASGRSVRSFGPAGEAGIEIRWSPRGGLLATNAGDVRVWDAAEGRMLRSLGADVPFGMAWSPDGTRIAAAYYSRSVCVFDASSGAEIRRLFAGSGAACVAWSPDGGLLAVGTRGQRVHIWDVATGEERRLLQGHEGWINALDWSPRGARVASGSADGTVKVWDLEEDRGERTVPGSPRGWFLSWSPGGRYLASVGPDGVTVWDSAERKSLWTVPGENGATWSGDGSRIAICGSDRKVTIHDALTGVEVPPHPRLRGRLAYRDGTSGFDWSRDGRRFAGVDSNRVMVWDAETGETLLAISDHVAALYSVSFSPDGGRLVYSSFEGPIPVWDLASGRKLWDLEGHRKWVNALAWSPDGKRLVTGGWDQTFKVWDMTTGRLLHSLDAHAGIAWAASWSPDGRRFATHGDDRVKVWDAESAEELVSFRGLHCVDWSPDGRKIATRGDGDLVAILDASAGYERAAALEAEERASDAALAGLRLAGEGDFEASDAAFALAVGADPGYPLPHLDRGAIHWQLGSWAGAIPDLREAVSRDPQDRIALDLLARCLALRPGSTIEDGREAVACAERSMAVCDARPHSAVTLGMALHRAGEHAAAARSLEAALAAGRDGSLCCERTATLFLSMACWRLGDRPRARDLYGSALRASDGHSGSQDARAARTEAAVLLGDLAWIDEEWTRSAEDPALRDELAARIGALDPEDAPAIAREYAGALALQREGRHAQAIPAFERVLGATREHVAPFLRLAESLRASGDSEAAAACIRQAIESAGDDDPRLGDLWLSVGLGDLGRSPAALLEELRRADAPGEKARPHRAILEVLAQGGGPAEVPREVFEESAGETISSRLEAYARERARGEIRACLDAIGPEMRLVETDAVGGKGGDYFRDVPAEPALVVGFEVSYEEHHGRRSLKSIAPLLHGREGSFPGALRGFKGTETERVEAAPGFAVGALIVDGGDRVSGFRVRFFRIAEDGLDPNAAYESAWLGGPGRGQPLVLGGTGEPVVGIHGHSLSALDALGLVCLECERSPLDDHAAIDRAIERALDRALVRRLDGEIERGTDRAADRGTDHLETAAEALRRIADRLDRSGRPETREARARYLRGRELQLSGNHREASAVFDDVVSLDAASVEPLIRLCESLAAAGEAAAAEARLRRAIEDRFAAAEDAWRLWFRLSFADLRRSPAEVIRTFPRPAGADAADAAYSRQDALWLLAALARDGVARMNCGGAACVDARGRVWGRDRLRRAGQGHASEARPDDDDAPPEVLAAVAAFPSILRGPHGYGLPVPPGKYRLTLLLHEPFPRAGSPRRLGASADGQAILRDYAPRKGKVDRASIDLAVSDGLLEIDLAAGRREPVISGIEIRALEATLEELPPAMLGQDPDLLEERGRELAARGNPREAVPALERAIAFGSSAPAVAAELLSSRERLLPDLATCASIDARLEEEEPSAVPRGAVWRYFRGIREPSGGLEWTRLDFDDSGWEEGPSGFGYGDDDDATVLADMRGRYSTVYVRKVLELEPVLPWERIVLSVASDDGFVAYVDGTEVGRAGAGRAGTRLPFHALSDSAAEEPLVPTRIVLDTSLLRPGSMVLALQGLNQTLDSSDFSLIPELRREAEPDALKIPGIPRVVRFLEACGTPAARRLLDDLAREWAWPCPTVPPAGAAGPVGAPAPPGASREELEAAWARLAGGDGPRSDAAAADIIRAGDPGVALVREELRRLGEEARDGRAARDSGRFAAFRAAAAGKGGEGRLAYLEARLLQRLGRHEEAAVAFAEAARLDPASVEPALGAAESLRALGDGRAAAERLRAALRGPALGSIACWDLWLEIVVEGLGWTIGEVLDGLPGEDVEAAAGDAARDEYALRCRTAMEDLRACGALRLDAVGAARWPPVVTVAYWRFEEGSPGRLPFDIEEGPRDADGQPPAAALDSSGHGNHLYAFAPRTAPRFGSDVPAPIVPQTGRPNRGCLDDRGEPPPGTPTQDLYSGAAPPLRPGVAIESLRLREWTVEASFRLATLGRIHGILSKWAPRSRPSEGACLQLLVLEDGTIRLEATDEAETRRAVASPVPVEAGRWYHVAATSDGSRLRLYIDRGGGEGYRVEDETRFEGALVPAVAGWGVGRGDVHGTIAHDARAAIDEVRISAAALPPERFLFAPRD